MIKRNAILICFLLTCFCLFAQKQESGPNKLQKEQIARGYGMFIHFGINTFNQIEWSYGNLPVSSYNPTELDCDQWVKTAKEVGFRYIILITKHHDGFCLWDSEYTDYDVASSPVKTDVVAEVAKACKKYGVKLGLYYSLWDNHEPSYKNTPKYLKFMKGQLTELLTNYGDICELWFDGGWDKPAADWKLGDVYKYVKKMQPNCLMAVNHTIGKPDDVNAIRQPVNYKKGDPIHYFPADFRIKDPNLARWDDPKYYNYEGKSYYFPFEHTICLSDRWNWFQKKEMLDVRDLDELEELFYWTTANDNLLIVNMPPDQRGKIRSHERIRMLQLADRLGIRNGNKTLPTGPKNLTFNQKISTNGGHNGEHTIDKAVDTSLETFWTAKDTIANLEIDFGDTVAFDKVTLFEQGEMKPLGDGFSIARDFKVQEYALEYYHNGNWDTFYTGGTIGACETIRLPEILKATKIRLRIVRSVAPPSINHIGVSLMSTAGKRKIINN